MPVSKSPSKKCSLDGAELRHTRKAKKTKTLDGRGDLQQGL